MCFQIISQNDPKNFSSKKDLIKWTFLFFKPDLFNSNVKHVPIPLPSSKTHSITSNNCSFGCPIIYRDTNSRIGKRCLRYLLVMLFVTLQKTFQGMCHSGVNTLNLLSEQREIHHMCWSQCSLSLPGHNYWQLSKTFLNWRNWRIVLTNIMGGRMHVSLLVMWLASWLLFLCAVLSRPWLDPPRISSSDTLPFLSAKFYLNFIWVWN